MSDSRLDLIRITRAAHYASLSLILIGLGISFDIAVPGELAHAGALLATLNQVVIHVGRKRGVLETPAARAWQVLPAKIGVALVLATMLATLVHTTVLEIATFPVFLTTFAAHLVFSR